MTGKKGPGQVEVTFTYARHLGPYFMAGGVTLQFDSLRPYGFISQAIWPATDNFDNIVQEAVEGVLRERQGHLNSPSVLLKRIQWDEVSSSPESFRRAAAAATRAAFEV
jgi:hypothetical protein